MSIIRGCSVIWGYRESTPKERAHACPKRINLNDDAMSRHLQPMSTPHAMFSLFLERYWG